jgi:CubicO group peptidase (beta-lactamase class C family)
MAQIDGICVPRFERVRDLFQRYLDSGEEVGASITVNIEGEDVINLWGGFVDAERTRPWTENTIVPVASSTKMISALAVLMLADRGAISVCDKMSKYWPEFAANGKEDVEIRHCLSHTSGVAGWDEKLTMDDICDVASSAAKMAGQAPWWTPGTASAYHGWNYGHLLSEIVYRVTGMYLKEFIAKNITGPLGADFHIGLKEEDEARLSEFISSPPAGPPRDLGPLFMKVLGNPSMTPGMGRSKAWRNGEIGASNGYGNARALNTMLSQVTLAGCDGVKTDAKLLSTSTTDLIFQEQSYGKDLAVGKIIRFGIGYALRGNGDTWVDDWLPAGRVAYWGGSGGSLGIMDVDRKVTITYAMNQKSNEMIGNTASKAYIKAIYEALGIKMD